MVARQKRSFLRNKINSSQIVWRGSTYRSMKFSKDNSKGATLASCVNAAARRRVSSSSSSGYRPSRLVGRYFEQTSEGAILPGGSRCIVLFSLCRHTKPLVAVASRRKKNRPDRRKGKVCERIATTNDPAFCLSRPALYARIC